MTPVFLVTIEHPSDYAEVFAYTNYHAALTRAAEAILRRIAGEPADEGAAARGDCPAETLEALLEAYAEACEPLQTVTVHAVRLAVV